MNVEQELRQADVSHLDKELKENRAKMIQLLNQYWKREEFPKNTTHKTKIPQIKDKDGTPCAVAYIIDHSGNGKLVNHLASQNNLVYVEDVHDGPLLDWLKKSGITKQEAAKIQPDYMPIIQHHNYAVSTVDNITIGSNVTVTKIAGSHEPSIMIIISILLIAIGIFTYWRIRSFRSKSRKNRT